MNEDPKYRLINLSEDIHIIPMDDLMEHYCDINCECNPFIDPATKVDLRFKLNDKTIWIHRRMKDQENKN